MRTLRRWFGRITESDEARLASDIQAWSSSVPGAVPIAEATARRPVKIAGVVRRITVLPAAGHETLEALVTDGTGEAVVVLMGRRAMQGLDLGVRVVVEGMLGEQRGELRMVNPRLELSA